MTFAEFKNRFNIATRGDIKICDDEDFKVLISETAADIHRAVTPLEKVEIDDRNFVVDYYLDENYFVRKFVDVADDDSHIDFLDEMLLKALIYGIAVKWCSNEMLFKFDSLYKKAICEYELNNFDERSFDIEHALAARGWLKPYVMSEKLDQYVWNEYFLSKLEFWLANVPTLKHISYRKFIYDFIDFQNGKAKVQRKDMVELDRVMKNRIRP